MPEIADQTWESARYAAAGAFVPVLGLPVVELLAPQPGERILDLGCGNGDLAETIAAAGASVVAVDAAPELIAATRARGLDARLMDGQNLTFDREFDAVFSNAALHWMKDQDAVIAGVRRALKPGGRFVAEMGGHNNVAAVVVALAAVLARRGIDVRAHNPWYFPSAEAYRKKLETAGFRVEEIAIIPRPTYIAAGIEPWLDAFCEPFLKALPAGERLGARGEAVDLLRPVLVAEDGRWIADYVRLRFKAVLPG